MRSRYYFESRYGLTTNPAKTMTFADLESAVTTLKADPRVHSTSHVLLRYSLTDSLTGDMWDKEQPPRSILINGHDIVLSTTAAEPALLRP